MLAIRLGQSLPSSAPVNWSPLDSSKLAAWYQKGTGLELNGTDVATWKDQSANEVNMVQATASEQPAYANGILTFDASDTNNLQSTTQISISGEFTIGIRLNIGATGGIIIGDNTTNGEFLKVFSTNKLRVKIDNATAVDLQLDSGSLTSTEAYMVLTRNASNLLTLHWNGVAQADTETMSGTADIDAIGVRATDTNPYEGTIREIQIFKETSAALTANVNARLATL